MDSRLPIPEDENAIVTMAAEGHRTDRIAYVLGLDEDYVKDVRSRNQRQILNRRREFDQDARDIAKRIRDSDLRIDLAMADVIVDALHALATALAGDELTPAVKLRIATHLIRQSTERTLERQRITKLDATNERLADMEAANGDK